MASAFATSVADNEVESVRHHLSEMTADGHKIMKTVLLVLFATLFIAYAQAQENPMQPLTVVPEVDLQRYAGKWYEVARLPNRFQKQCTGDVSAICTLLDDGTIKIVNICRKESGQMKQAEGVAKLADKDGPNTKLKVRFAPKFLSFFPFVWGNYWIIDLTSDYSCTVIGEPSRKYLWVLSRTPTIDDSVLQIILDQVREKGYDLTGLIRTMQTEK